jgi:hypothetical protein
MSKSDLENVEDTLNRWQRRLERAIETGQEGMVAIAEQKIETYYRILREQVA